MNTDALIRGSRRTVLIVEDEAVNRELLGFILQGEYDLLYACDGVEALEALRARQGRVAMILSDIKMPRMDGIALLKALNADAELKKIPVIVLTSDKDSELETLRLGALDFITKPYDMPEIILARVRRIIEFVEDRQIIRDVEHDALTHLYNRGFFYEYARRVLEVPRQTPLDMIAVDVDHFRLVNEVYGKALGDEVLRAVADGVRGALTGGFGIACRLDADLFLLLMERPKDYDALYEEVIAPLRGLSRQAGVRLRMGVYPGVSAERPIEWYGDAAAFACGTIRGNYARSVAVYDDQLHARELYNERLITDVAEALRQGQFRVFFQPKYNVRGDVPRLCGAEALVRWVHPELGFISPGDFIPLFEENGLITRLDEYVWRQVAAQVRRWRECCGAALPVSVNLSQVDFFDGRLKDRLLAIVAENGISVKDFALEVTESAYSENVDQMLRTVAELREAGFIVEMDDFGSGYSSLNMLCVMPVDVLKIDMKFVRNIVAAGSGYRMVELVVEMARCLGLPTIVEGVENETQYEMVRRAGCDIVQGYYFSRPVDMDQFAQIVAEQAGKNDIQPQH